MLRMRLNYAMALFMDDDATLDDLREAVTTLEKTERIARRVLGGAHPTTTGIEENLQGARALLRALEEPPQPIEPAERLFRSEHPIATWIWRILQLAQSAFGTRESPQSG